jgi:hypothetical protein
MTDLYLHSAYDSLTQSEKQAVDEYVQFAAQEQRNKREAISGALVKPIPNEWILKTHRVLSRPVPMAAVVERLKQMSDAEDMSPDKVVREYITIGTSDIGDYMTRDAYGHLVMKALNEIDPIKRRAIKKIETRSTQYGPSTTLTLHDKLPALNALSEMMGLIAKDKQPVLQEYVTPKKLKAEIEELPEASYQELLESS